MTKIWIEMTAVKTMQIAKIVKQGLSGGDGE